MSMRLRRMLGGSVASLVIGLLTTALPGCGGGQETGPNGEVKVAPPLNPAPGVVPVEDEYKQQAPAKKGR